MKKWAPGLVLALAFAAAASAQNDALSDVCDYRGTFYHFSVRLPAAWEESPGGDLGDNVTLVLEAAGSSGSLRIVLVDVYETLRGQPGWVNVTRERVDRDLAADDAGLADQYFAPLRQELLESTREDAEFAGFPAARLRGSAGPSGTVDAWLLYHNGAVVITVAWTAAGASASEAEAIRRSLASVVVHRQYEPTAPTVADRLLPMALATLVVATILGVAVLAGWLAARRRAGPSLPMPESRPTLMERGGLAPDLPLATAGRRLANYAVDQLIVGLLTWALSALFGLVLGIASAIRGVEVPTEDLIRIAGFLIALATVVVYYGVAEGVCGRTIGKVVTRTVVVDGNGTRVGYARAFRRTFCRLIPFDHFSFLAGRRPVGWHDSLSGTYVIMFQHVPPASTVAPVSGGQPSASGDSVGTA